MEEDESGSMAATATDRVWLAGASEITVNEVHNNPTDIGSNSFFTQGTGFARQNFFQELICTDRILKTKASTKYYAEVNNASNKYLFLNNLRRNTDINETGSRKIYAISKRIHLFTNL